MKAPAFFNRPGSNSFRDWVYKLELGYQYKRIRQKRGLPAWPLAGPVIPVAEWQRTTVDMRTRTATVMRRETITKDSVTVKVNATKSVIAVEDC